MINILARLACTANDYCNVPHMTKRVSACQLAIKCISCIIAEWGDIEDHRKRLKEICQTPYKGTGFPPSYFNMDDCFKADLCITEVEELLSSIEQDKVRELNNRYNKLPEKYK